MENERSVDRLARYIIALGSIALAAWFCWYFKSVIIYIICAFVLSLLCQPIMKTLKKLQIKGKSAPDWLLAIFSLALIFFLFITIVTKAVPIVSGIVSDASIMSNIQGAGAEPIAVVNSWLIDLFPNLGPDFNIFSVITNELKEIGSISNITGILGSLASAVSSIAIALFSTVFIAFFFIKDGNLFKRIVASLVPDKIEESVCKTVDEIGILLSRYFMGLTIEVIGVALLNFLGLFLIARLSVNHAIGIAFISGILNIIPYVGPMAGGIIGVVLAMILKIGAGAGVAVNVWVFALIVMAIMAVTQLVDNFVYQPIIYSTSIKANPLEIFIIILIAGRLGGMIGVLVAIPAYTVIRVIAIRFFRHYKPIRRLLPEQDKEEELFRF